MSNHRLKEENEELRKGLDVIKQKVSSCDRLSHNDDKPK